MILGGNGSASFQTQFNTEPVVLDHLVLVKQVIIGINWLACLVSRNRMIN